MAVRSVPPVLLAPSPCTLLQCSPVCCSLTGFQVAAAFFTVRTSIYSLVHCSPQAGFACCRPSYLALRGCSPFCCPEPHLLLSALQQPILPSFPVCFTVGFSPWYCPQAHPCCFGLHLSTHNSSLIHVPACPWPWATDPYTALVRALSGACTPPLRFCGLPLLFTCLHLAYTSPPSPHYNTYNTG